MMRALQGYAERMYPFGIALGMFWAAWLRLPPLSEATVSALTAMMATVAAVSVGFLATLLILLAAFSRARAWIFLQEAGRLPQLVRYVRQPLDGALALLGLSLLLSSAGASTGWWGSRGVVLAIALFAFLITSMFRLTRVLRVLLPGA